MEHPKELILSGSDTMQYAAMFGLLFEERPTYTDLVSGTPQLAHIFELNSPLQTSEEQFVTSRGIAVHNTKYKNLRYR